MGIKINSGEISASGRATAGVKGITLKKDDFVVAALPVRNKTDYIAIFSSKGLGKKIEMDELVLQKRAGKGLIIYKPTDETGTVISGALIADEDNILVVGKLSSICISAKDIPLASRIATGNQLIKNGEITSVTKI